MGAQIEPPPQSLGADDLDDSGRRPAGSGSSIPLGAGLVEDALGPTVVVVDSDEGPTVPDARVVVLGLVLLKAEVGQGTDEAAADSADASADPGAGDGRAYRRCRRHSRVRLLRRPDRSQGSPGPRSRPAAP